MPYRRLLRTIVERNGWSSLSMYGEFMEMKQEGKLLLGFAGRTNGREVVMNPKKPAYIKFDLESDNCPNILLFGRKGSGKTTLEMFLIRQLFGFGCNVFAVDPKASIATHKYPQNDRFQNQFLQSVNIEPSGLPIKTITPAMFKDSSKFSHTDEFYSVGMSDFDRIKDFSFRKELMSSLLGVGDSNAIASQRKLVEVLLRNPKSFAEMISFTNSINTTSKYFRNIGMFDATLRQRIREGVISDNAAIDIVDMMSQRQIVALQCSLSPTEEINSTYVALALAQIKDGLERKALNGKTILAFDEADVLAPAGNANPPSKTFVTHAYTKWRSDGIIPLAVVQDPMALNQSIVQQVDVTLCPRITIGNESTFLTRQYPSAAMNVYQLTGLAYGDTSTYPKEWCAIDSEQNIRTFYPCFSPSMTTFPKVDGED